MSRTALAFGSKAEILKARQCRPIYLRKRTWQIALLHSNELRFKNT
jgi:hypothetical protein